MGACETSQVLLVGVRGVFFFLGVLPFSPIQVYSVNDFKIVNSIVGWAWCILKLLHQIIMIIETYNVYFLVIRHAQ